MSRQCPGCNKLAGLETSEPEAEIDINGTTVSATVRLVRTSMCCGDEMKEASFEPTHDIDPELLKHHFDPKTGEPVTEECELEVEDDGCELTERSEGKGRGTRTFFGFELHWSVTCACKRNAAGEEVKHGVEATLAEGTFEDDVQASHMEELT